VEILASQLAEIIMSQAVELAEPKVNSVSPSLGIVAVPR